MKHTLDEYMALYAHEHTKTGTRVTHFFGIPMIVASLPLAFLKPRAALGLFVGGWALQLIGHRIEGNKPAFAADPFYLLVGPIWVARELKQIVCREGCA
jgi:uncharacterized membrane protein YGL010W